MIGRGGCRKGAGRPKGALNKRTIEVQQTLQALDCPFEGMQRVAHDAEQKGDLSTAGRMYAELASYLAPKQKSVEYQEKSKTGLEDLNLEQLGKLKQTVLEGNYEVLEKA